MVLVSTAVRLKTEQKAESFSLLRKTGSDGDARTDSSRMFQTDNVCHVTLKGQGCVTDMFGCKFLAEFARC